MSERSVFVVMGVTGEYSDRGEWPVCAYFDEAVAQRHAECATKRAAEIFAVTPRHKEPVEPNEYDANMSMDYTGTHYFVMTVKLREGK